MAVVDDGEVEDIDVEETLEEMLDGILGEEEELEEGGQKGEDQSKTRSDYKNFKDTDPDYHGKDGESHGDQGEPDDYAKNEALVQEVLKRVKTRLTKLSKARK